MKHEKNERYQIIFLRFLQFRQELDMKFVTFIKKEGSYIGYITVTTV
jgi:hypothetical protein